MSTSIYLWDAEEYAQHSSAQFAWAKELVDKLDLHGWEHVLDIGCGDGKVSAHIAKRLPHGSVTGIDNSLAMIERARGMFTSDLCQNLHFEIMDACAINLSEYYDRIFSNAALHWVHDHLAVLRGVKRCLNPSGSILFQMGGKGNAQGVVEVITNIISQPHWSDYFKNFPFPYSFLSVEEYEKLLNRAGLFPVRLELVPKDMMHNGRDGLKGWVRTTWLPYTQRLPEAMREPFIAKTVDDYLSLHPMDNRGLTHVEMVRLEVEAVNMRDGVS